MSVSSSSSHSTGSSTQAGRSPSAGSPTRVGTSRSEDSSRSDGRGSRPRGAEVAAGCAALLLLACGAQTGGPQTTRTMIPQSTEPVQQVVDDSGRDLPGSGAERPPAVSRWDFDGDGRLGPAELAAAMFEAADRDDDGALNRQELLGQLPADTVAPFEDFDGDEDGAVGLIELREALLQTGTFARWDLNGDRALDPAELASPLPRQAAAVPTRGAWSR